MTDEFGYLLQTRDKRDTLSHIDGQHPNGLESDLVELERKLIPLLNRTRAMLGKPPIIAPKENHEQNG